MKHDLYDREDGLSHCKVCNGAEASLPTDCPGEPMAHTVEEMVQAGTLNYAKGKWWISADWYEDKPDQWTPHIDAAHPLRTKNFDVHRTAVEMVGNRYSKGALVALVCYLLTVIENLRNLVVRMRGNYPLPFGHGHEELVAADRALGNATPAGRE